MDLKNIYLWIKLILVLIAVSLFIFILYYEYFVIDIIESRNSIESYMFTILNSLLFGVYLNITGFGVKITKRWIKYFLLIVILYLITTGFGNFGLSFTIYLPADLRWLLQYRTYCSNTRDGIWFISYNWYILIIILGISFFTEAEI